MKMMIAFHPSSATAYTSLKDIMPPSPPSILSPNSNAPLKDSWREIPVKDPLLQRAVWAYLQPVHLPQVHGRTFFHKLKDSCFRFFACFNDLFIVVLNRLLPHQHL